MILESMPDGGVRIELQAGEELYLQTTADGPMVVCRKMESGELTIQVDNDATDMQMIEKDNQFIFSFFTP